MITTMIDMCRFLFRAFRVSGRVERVHGNEWEDNWSSTVYDLNITERVPEDDSKRCFVTPANIHKW